MIPVIDMHCDTVAAIELNQRIGRSKSCAGSDSHEREQKNTALRENTLAVDLVRMKQGGYLCQSFAIFMDLEDVKKNGLTPFAHGLAVSDVFDEEVGKNADLIRPVTSGTQIAKNLEEGYLCALKTVEEGGVYEGKLENLKELYARGVRKSTLTWNYRNELAFPNPAEYDPVMKQVNCTRLDEVNGLTETGFAFVSAMEEMGMLIDISHLNDAGIRDVFAAVKPDTPIVASHSNARGVCFHPRNLSDDMIRNLAERGGIMGINYCGAFLNEAYQNVAAEKDCKSRIEDMLRHMKYVRNLGGIEVLGLGSDFDGIGGDLEMKGAEDVQLLAEAMESAGFTLDEIEKVFYKNALRVYTQVLG